MIVMKFGGTSVEDAPAMRNVSKIVRDNVARKPVVVVSACAGVTNTLLALARGSPLSGWGKSLEQVNELRSRHLKIAHALFEGEILFTVQSQLDAMFDSLRDLVRSISILGELTDRSLDLFASYGERLSSLLLYHQFKQDALNAVYVNAQEVVITNDDFMRAVPLFEEIQRRVRTVVEPKLAQNHVIVTQGFLGATTAGIPTTLGRGGSDYSASILGAALGAEEIQIWTDVDGIMTCDPSIVKDARLISSLTFQEAAELAYFGAKVLHPATILPAVQKNIPVRVLNSKRPEGAGTTIVNEVVPGEETLIRAIACKSHITLITIISTRMLMMHGFLAKVFEVFAKYEISVDVIATSEVSVSLTVDNEGTLDGVLHDLRLIADVELARDKAIVCVVGEKIKSGKGIIPRLFDTLDTNNIGVRLISLGASDINITFVVDGQEVEKTVGLLHDQFFPLS
jgi:aspartate kinase